MNPAAIQHMRDTDQPIPVDLDSLMLVGALLLETWTHGENNHEPGCPMTQDALMTCTELLSRAIRDGLQVMDAMQAESN